MIDTSENLSGYVAYCEFYIKKEDNFNLHENFMLALPSNGYKLLQQISLGSPYYKDHFTDTISKEDAVKPVIISVIP